MLTGPAPDLHRSPIQVAEAGASSRLPAPRCNSRDHRQAIPSLPTLNGGRGALQSTITTVSAAKSVEREGTFSEDESPLLLANTL